MLNRTHKKLQKCLWAHVFDKVRTTNLVDKVSKKFIDSHCQIDIIFDVIGGDLSCKAFHMSGKFNIYTHTHTHIPRSQVLPYEVEATIAIVFDSQNHKLYGGII
jgi:hypothetical protein